MASTFEMFVFETYVLKCVFEMGLKYPFSNKCLKKLAVLFEMAFSTSFFEMLTSFV